uniref:Uncharacterized protein n=1 Tax=Utricularia reniformis TaxID=192314 RepID=A0A1Y0AZA7_9LAMI|nr:hypothetical protein AEK19_MT0238 [Utricularia reniformis]ART30516.1 hypothetical protein AEK19_MT0238 [Utricularia reniformis]
MSFYPSIAVRVEDKSSLFCPIVLYSIQRSPLLLSLMAFFAVMSTVNVSMAFFDVQILVVEHIN